MFTEFTIKRYVYKFNMYTHPIKHQKIICKYNNSSYHQLIIRKQYICSHMTEKLLTFMLKHIINVFINLLYENKFADCDTGLLIKDGWNDQSWFLMNGKSRKKKNKHVKN